MGMISYTLAILFFALKPTVKKFLSIEIEIVIPSHSQKHNKKISVTGSCVEQT
jgi:hypothetical protein